MIPRAEIDHIKGLSNIETLMERYGIELKPSGMNLKGLCPFHDEKSPSFNVRPSSNTYHCFGCGESGDSLAFIQHKEGLTFTESVVFLAELVGYEIKSTSAQEDEGGISKRRLYAVVEAAAAFYRENYRNLPATHVARNELRNRKFEADDNEFLTNLGIGYSPEGWTKLYDHLRGLKFTQEEIQTAGLCSTSPKSGRAYDMFRGRLMWEIRDIQGRVIGFGGRRLFENDKGPKYLNSPETPIYHKSDVLYGLDLSRQAVRSTKEIYVVEGYTDVMAFRAVGIQNVVASSGTAFGEGHTSVLRRLMGDEGRFVFFFDGDAAGQKAALKTFELSAPIHSRAFVAVAQGGDPCDIRIAQGDEALVKQVSKENQQPLTRFVLRSELAKHDVTSPEGRADYLNAVRPLLARLTDYSMREDYKRQVALWSATTLDVVNQILGNARITRVEENTFVDQEEQNVYERLQRDMLALALQHPKATAQGLGYKKWDIELLPAYSPQFVTHVWNNAMDGVVSTPGMFPDEEETVIKLLHIPFAFESLKLNEKELKQAVMRTAKTTYKGLVECQKNAQVARFTQRLASVQGAEDGSGAVLAELMEERARIPRRRIVR